MKRILSFDPLAKTKVELKLSPSSTFDSEFELVFSADGEYDYKIKDYNDGIKRVFKKNHYK